MKRSFAEREQWLLGDGRFGWSKTVPAGPLGWTDPVALAVFAVRQRLVCSIPRPDAERLCEQCFRGADVTLTSGYGPWRMQLGLSNS